MASFHGVMAFNATPLVRTFRVDDGLYKFTGVFDLTATAPNGPGWSVFGSPFMAMSPNGRWLVMIASSASVANRAALYRRVGNQWVYQLALVDVSSLWTPAWSPDSRKLFIGRTSSPGGYLFVLNAAGTGFDQITDITGFPSNIRSPVWDDNNNTLYFTTNGNGNLYIATVTDVAAITAIFAAGLATNGAPIYYSRGSGLITVNNTTFTLRSTTGAAIASVSDPLGTAPGPVVVSGSIIYYHYNAIVTAANGARLMGQVLKTTPTTIAISNVMIANTTTTPLGRSLTSWGPPEDKSLLIIGADTVGIIMRPATTADNYNIVGGIYDPIPPPVSTRNLTTSYTSVDPVMQLYANGPNRLTKDATSRSLKLMLVTTATTFLASATTLAAALASGGGAEVSGNGWPAGGATVVGLNVIEVPGIGARLMGGDTGAVASGGSIVGRKAILYDTAGDVPLAFIDFGANITAIAGDRLSIRFDETGIIDYVI